MSTYVPGTLESDPKKIIMSLQQVGPKLDTAIANIATNTTNIATLQAQTAGYEAAWTAWAPTVTPGSGSFTSVSAAGAYLVIGKLVHFTVSITITTAGTAASTMSIPLPIGTAKRNCCVFAEDFGGVGKVGFGRIAGGSTVLNSILMFDNSTYIATGNVVVLTGIYEQT